MTKIIMFTLTAAVLLGMGYAALLLLGQLAVLIDTNDYAAGGAAVLVANALALTARR